MGYNVDVAERDIAAVSRAVPWANAVACGACLFDYFVSDRPWALATLVIFILLINGGFLVLKHFQMRCAYERDARDAAEKAKFEAEREERMKNRGWR